MGQVGKAGVKECLGLAGQGKGLGGGSAWPSVPGFAIAQVGLPARRGRGSGCKNHRGASLKAGCSTEPLWREGLCSGRGLWGC